MGIWAKNKTEFVVSVSFIVGAGSSYGCVPKPILTKLGNPKKIGTPYKTTKFWSAMQIHNKANHVMRIKCIIYLIPRVCPRT